jgi:hypothetical protein
MTEFLPKERLPHHPEPVPEVHRVPVAPEIPIIGDVEDFLRKQEKTSDEKRRREPPSRTIH